MPHQFFPEKITIKVPNVSGAPPQIFEVRFSGITNVTPPKPTLNLPDFRGFNPTGDFFKRGAHANIDIVIESTVEGIRESSVLAGQIGRAVFATLRG